MKYMDSSVPQINDPMAPAPIPNVGPTNPDPVVSQTPPSKPKASLKRVVVTLFGLVFLVGAVGAGVFLASQNQQTANHAASDCTQTGTTITCTGTGPYHVVTCHSTTNTGTTYPGCVTSDNCTTQVENGPLNLTVSAPNCGSNQVDVQELGTGGGGICAGAGHACQTGNVCGGTCTTNADCISQGASGGTVACIAGTCQNTACPGKTVPGANCDCSTLNACGQPCSAAAGLCQAGSTCAYIVGPNCTNNPNASQPTNTYCVPATLPTGWTSPKCVARDQGNNYVLDSGQNPTVAQIQAACAPATPTPAPTPTPSTITAACSNIAAYDTNWAPLTIAQLSQLTPGTKVNLAVTGTTTGTLDQARFTINGDLQSPVTTTKPGDASTFYMVYTIPSAVTNFSITAEVHEVSLNQWF